MSSESPIFKPNNKEELLEAVNLLKKKERVALDKYGSPEIWDTSLITDMSHLFKNFNKFDYNINNWNVSNVINMEGMFINAKKFNQPLDMWDVSKVKNMNSMFINCNNFNQNLSTWKLSSLETKKNIFFKCDSFYNSLNNWDFTDIIELTTYFSNEFYKSEYFYEILINNDFSKEQKNVTHLIKMSILMDNNISKEKFIILIKKIINDYIQYVDLSYIFRLATSYDSYDFIFELINNGYLPDDFTFKIMTIGLVKSENRENYETFLKVSPYKVKEKLSIDDATYNDLWYFVKYESKFQSFLVHLKVFYDEDIIDSIVENK